MTPTGDWGGTEDVCSGRIARPGAVAGDSERWHGCGSEDREKLSQQGAGTRETSKAGAESHVICHLRRNLKKHLTSDISGREESPMKTQTPNQPPAAGFSCQESLNALDALSQPECPGEAGPAGRHAECEQRDLSRGAGLTSTILVVLRTVHLQFQGQFVPMSLRPILRIVAALVLATVWASCS